MSRRWVVSLALVAAVLGGCGVATETGVVRDGDGPRGQSDPGGVTVRPPQREDAPNDPRDFIDNYLRSASPDPGLSIERLRRYLLPGVGPGWTPDPLVTVVRKVDDYRVTPLAGGGAEVVVHLQPVGTLTEFGAVDPPANRNRIDYGFTVVPSPEADQRGLFLTNPRPQILLLDTALAKSALYEPYPIYFWDNDNQVLVPDVRYLSKSIPEQQRPTEVLRWLLNGPSSLLRQTAHGLPAGTELRGSGVYLQDDRLMVNLSAKATGLADQLMPQLRWSLWRLYSGKLGLLTEGVRAATDDSPEKYRWANATAALPTVPEVMCVTGGVVVGHCDTAGPGAPADQVPGPMNTAVVAAAIGTSPNGPIRSAVVRTEGRNSRRLWVGTAGPPAVYGATDLVAPTMSRPVWLRPGNANPVTQTGLVAAKGQLHRFVASPSATVTAALPVPEENQTSNLTGITAVAAAPDARRIALVAGGRLYVAPLLVSSGTVSVGAARRLDTILRDLTAVSFKTEGSLLVAGQDGSGSRVGEVSLDGMLDSPYERNLGTVKITQLVAYPDDPVDQRLRGFVMVEADGRAAKAFQTSLADLDQTTPKSAPFYVD